MLTRAACSKIITTGAKPFVSIDNRSGRGVSSLHQLIDHTVAQQDHVKLQVSIAWMQTLDKLVSSKKTWCNLSSVLAQGEAHGITSKAEVEKMLQLFHELGVVFHFNTTEHLKELVCHYSHLSITVEKYGIMHVLLNKEVATANCFLKTLLLQ